MAHSRKSLVCNELSSQQYFLRSLQKVVNPRRPLIFLLYWHLKGISLIFTEYANIAVQYMSSHQSVFEVQQSKNNFYGAPLTFRCAQKIDLQKTQKNHINCSWADIHLLKKLSWQHLLLICDRLTNLWWRYIEKSCETIDPHYRGEIARWMKTREQSLAFSMMTESICLQSSVWALCVLSCALL